MASRIITKKGSGAPLASDLVHGELAVDTVNKRLYTENAGGTIIELGTAPSTIDINAGTIDGTVIGGSSAAAGSFTTISASGEIAANGGIALGDNDKATFGASDDLQIFHNGTHSYIEDAGTGDLNIKGADIKIISSDSENMASFARNGAVTLYYDNAAKLATTSTGVDVTGTVTADGLTVDGNVGIGTSSPSSYNANANNLVISEAGNAGLTIATGTANEGALYFADGTVGLDSARGAVYYSHATNHMGLATNGAERARIDASGNLLVGKTVGGALGTAGVELRPNNLYVTSDNSIPIYVNRLTSDGEIISLRKDGTTVGSIGVNVNDLTLGNGITGISFLDSADAITPHNITTNAARDGAVDIGVASRRFKDLYLSGGVYLGGTGAANLLDDYEEGTWTPVLTDGTTVYTLANGIYTKVGNLVTVSVTASFVTSTTATTGTAYISGLPFTSTGNSAHGAVGTYHTRESILTYDVLTDGNIVARANVNSNVVDLIAIGSTNDYERNIPLNDLINSSGTATNFVSLTISYFTNL